MKYKTKEEILLKAKELEGKKFGEYDFKGRLLNTKNKGALGQVIEEGFFEYKVNNRPEADFLEAGVELKVTPFKVNKNRTISAKERLVLNIIDYVNENLTDFYDSSFWKKNSRLLIVFYQYLTDVINKDLEIGHILLWEYPPEDLEIIKNDWNRIVDKIKNGLAHELSEGDTLYLGACRKGNKDTKKVKQPFSSIKAHKRAYSLKQGYMTYILRNHVLKNKQKTERIIKDLDVLKSKSFEEYLISLFNPYFGKTTKELYDKFNVSKSAKNRNQLVISKILKITTSIVKTEEFKKGGYKLKTIRINKKGKIKESMSFPYFSYFDVFNDSWEKSETREFFYNSRFMFVVFLENNDGEYLFDKVKFLSLSEGVIEKHIGKVYRKTRAVIRKGDIVQKFQDGKIYNNFPGIKDDDVCHVRPHAKNKKDTVPLPVKDNLTGVSEFTKMSFWLKNTYILSLIND